MRCKVEGLAESVSGAVAWKEARNPSSACSSEGEKSERVVGMEEEEEASVVVTMLLAC